MKRRMLLLGYKLGKWNLFVTTVLSCPTTLLCQRALFDCLFKLKSANLNLFYMRVLM